PDAGAGDTGADPGESAVLASLTLSAGDLSPAFAPGEVTYLVEAGTLSHTTTVTAVPVSPRAQISLNAIPIAAGIPSRPVALTGSNTSIVISVTVPGGAPRQYSVTVHHNTSLAQLAYVK